MLRLIDKFGCCIYLPDHPYYIEPALKRGWIVRPLRKKQ